LARSIAYAWLPTELAVGAAVSVAYLDRTYTATVKAEPVVDPDMNLIRR
jgi:dimethylglycine oxidase